MASYLAIAAVSKTVLSFLSSARPASQFGGAKFLPYQAAEFKTAGEFANATDLGITLCLYRVEINTAVRTAPARETPDGRRFRPSLPLDLHFLLTAWSANAETQQRLLGWALRALADFPFLPASVLNSAGPETDVFGPDESVELMIEPISLSDLTSLWDELNQPKAIPSVGLLARVVQIESQVELGQYPPVQVRDFGFTGEVQP